MSLEIRGLGLSFRQHNGRRLEPLSGVNLTLDAGEVVGIVGSSGAGKSLVAAAIMGLLPRNAEATGSVQIDGAPITKGDVALAPQGIDALDPMAPVGRQLTRFARLAGLSADAGRRRIENIMQQVQLPAPVLTLYPHMLSGGMAKRVLLATALIGRARILIADEPTLGVDPATADQIMNCLGGLAGPERAVLVISHDLPRLLGIAARLTVLKDGRMVEVCPSEHFRGIGERLVHPFTQALWQAQPVAVSA
ncbi:ATP-binding cassette domain-containing protein [Pontibaca salina]|uniref:Nickel import system ATP-binding protein NikD n=1 Tax=Pontibaca salina TaxID=2795731 RepID=A0A934HQN0_9RHOB|nr:ATP-binding cassette domain-containing protein [Pontibaca salina]MBI6629942.1 ABC transporter ATP-binding protein [Pontibaca salina]